MQKLVWSQSKVTGGKIYKETLPTPEINLDYYKDICVLAIPNESPTIEKIIDISKRMDNSGKIVWSVPKGEYTIYRFGHTSTGKETHPKPGDFRSLEADKLSESTMKYHADNVLAPLISNLGNHVGKTFRHVVFDSYEAGKQNWTNRMMQEFKRRKGYDMTKWLPAITGLQISGKDSTIRFLNDFKSVVADMLSEYGYGVPANIFRKKGLQVYIEPYGGDIHLSDVTKHADIPMTEFWTNSKSAISNVAKSGNPYSFDIISAEAFTGWPTLSMWSETPGMMKAPGDRAFALSGVNRMVLHGWVHQPFSDNIKPGLCMSWWGTHFGRNQTWHKYSSDWLTYLSRCQYLLQSSKEAVNILTLGKYPISLDIPAAGDLISDNSLINDIVVSGNKIKVKNSNRKYFLLILPESDTMKISVLKAVEKLVKKGAIVYGPKPLVPEGLNSANTDFSAIANKVWGKVDGVLVKSNSYGKGKIIYGYDLAEIEENLNLPKDRIHVIGDNGDKLYWCHKMTDDSQHLYFFANNDRYDLILTADLAIMGMEPELWYPATGEIRRLGEWSLEGERMNVKLKLKGNESVFLVFRNKVNNSGFSSFVNSQVDENQYNLEQLTGNKWGIRTSEEGLFEIKKTDRSLLKALVSDIPTETIIDEIWNVNFRPATAEKDFNKNLTKLESWTKSDDERVKYFSGTAVYNTTFDISTEKISDNIFAKLDLGNVKDVAEVLINGKKVAVLWHYPYVCDITNYLIEGKNRLEIAVTNTWANRLIGDESHENDCEWGEERFFHRLDEQGRKPFVGKNLKTLPSWLLKDEDRPSKKRTTFSSWNYFTQVSPLLESGLLDQVKIKYEKWVELE